MNALTSPPHRFAIRALAPRARSLLDPDTIAMLHVCMGAYGSPDDVVKEVEATSHFLSLDEVGAALKAGVLRSTDLVFEHGAWCPLTASVGLGELSQPWARREAWVRRLKSVAVFVGGLCWVAFLFWLRATERP